jgi:hypothetical protein
MTYIIAPSSLAGRGLGVGFLYLITPEIAVYEESERRKKKSTQFPIPNYLI